MALILFVVALVILVGTWFLDRPKVRKNPVDLVALSAAVLATLALLAAAHQWLKPDQLAATGWGLVFGSALVLLSGFFDGISQPGTIGLAFGCLAASLFSWLQLDSDPSSLGLVLGAGSTAVLLRIRASSFASVAILAAAFVHLLGNTKGAPMTADLTASTCTGVFAVFAFLLLVARNFTSRAYVKPIAAVIAGLVAIAIIGRFCYPGATDWTGLLTVPITVGVIYWLQTASPERPLLAHALSTLMWIGLATVAFGIQRGLGIGIAFLVATGVLLLLEAELTLVSAGPLLALVLHRAFRQEHPGVAGGIDIGQHYALMGFALAAILPLLPVEWDAIHHDMRMWANRGSRMLWLLALLAAPFLVALFLAPKGLLGFVTGLGFSGFFAWANRRADLSVLSLASAIGAAAILEYDSTQQFADLTRNEKIHWFLLTGVALLAFAGLLAALSSIKTKQPIEAP